MAVNGCGCSDGLTEAEVKSLINDLIDSGKLQGGLKSCDGDSLSTGQKVVLCDTLAATVNQLIKDGKVDVVTDVTVKDGKLVVTDGTGNKSEVDLPFVKDLAVKDGKVVVTKADGSKEEYTLPTGVTDLAFDSSTNKLTWLENGKDKSATLPYVKAVAGTNEVVFTLPDGTTVGLPKADSVLTPDNLDHTIQKGTNVPDKYGVKLKDKGGLSAKTTDGLEVLTGAGLTKDANGNVAVKPGTGLTTDGDGNLKIDGAGVAKDIADGLAGSGLTANNGQLSVATVRLMDASGTVHLGDLVDVTK